MSVHICAQTHIHASSCMHTSPQSVTMLPCGWKTAKFHSSAALGSVQPQAASLAPARHTVLI